MKADTRRARLIMELREGGVTDPAVLSAIETVPRDAFVPEVFRDRAWENTPLPIGSGQTISQPLIVALMTEALQVGKRHRVLEIGTGSGYQSAILARLCRRLYTIERIRELLLTAEARFAELGLHNITTMLGDGSKGWPEQAPFDRVIVTAAAPQMPQTLLDQVGEGGIIVVPVGSNADDQMLLRLRRTATGFEEENLTGVRFVPLIEDAT